MSDFEKHASSPMERDSETDERGRVRRRMWWIVALLLLLLLVGCVVLQLLWPSPRASKGKPTAGLVPVFSIYGLTQPLNVTTGPEGQLVISDTGVQRAYIYDDEGNIVARLGNDKAGSRVFSPDGAAYAGDTVYLTDWNMRRVWMFDSKGRVTGYFPKNPTAKEYGSKGFTPYDVTVLGSDLLVTSYDGVHRFDGATKQHEGRFDVGKADSRALDYPNGIVVSEDGTRVYVADTLNKRVVAFDSKGQPVWWLGRPDQGGRAVSIFGLPRGLAVSDGRLLVSDTFAQRLLVLDAQGKLLGTYGKRGVVDGELNFPEGIDVAPDGLLYLADRENNRVQVLRLGSPVAPDVDLQKKWRSDYASARR